ncbi:DinB family protein [Pseudoflavitalea sp. X16]|uniref:DinB family protein n=1 Tax=Paraflavitalea devenefica TaxID=2716334 RepID=UPI00141E5D65|nr:DinB family protein [Paraflavitalea devenefica]NII27322.1 DinB family protein [Paraflavitalea devenefica]
MSPIQTLLKEMNQEAETTRKMLARVPDDRYDWQPHEKSMSIRRLATHIAELPSWVSMTLTTSELDFAQNPYSVPAINNTKDLLTYFEQSLADGRSHLEKATEEDLEADWTLRNGNQVYSVNSKAEVIRMSYCQIVHHRAQLGVYLRLLNVPIPGSYGPSADEMDF